MTDTPTDITLNGKCSAMDAPTRTFRMKDIDGTEHPFKWTEPLDVVMVKNGEAKWKVGYYLSVTYNPDTHAVKNVTYWNEGKDKFPKNQSGGGGRPYTPRNEKPMIYLCAYKEACETVRALILQPDAVLDETEFDRVMDIALKRALKDGAELCKAGGC